VTVDAATQDGTATAPADYDALATSLLFAPGETSKTVDVSVHGDNAIEGNETFILELSGATNASISDANGVATILDDDDVTSHEPSSPIASIGDVSIEEGNAGETSTATYDLRLTRPAVGDVTLGFRSVAGTATDGHDYLGVAGIMTIPAGSVDSQVVMTVLGDNKVETDETFIVEITSVLGARVGSPGTGTIVNDDKVATRLTVRKHVFGSRVAVRGRLVRGAKGFPIRVVLMRRKGGHWQTVDRHVANTRTRAHHDQGGARTFGYRTIFRHVDPGHYRIRTVFRGDATHADSRAHVRFRV
jgi:hypothetical protein